MYKVFGIISLLMFTFCYVPQVYKTLRYQQVEGMSKLLWWMVSIGQITGFIYVWQFSDWIILAVYGVGAVCSIWILGACYIYQK